MSGDRDDRAQEVQVDRQLGDGPVQRGFIEKRLHNAQQWSYSAEEWTMVGNNYCN